MAKRGQRPRGRLTQAKMFHSAMLLILEQGFDNTTISQISEKAGMAESAFYRAFKDKESLLLAMTANVFDKQFIIAEQLLGENRDPLLLYGAETAVQMHIAELSEPLRDLYVAAYSLPSTSEYIYKSAAARFPAFFSRYMPAETEAKDYYELEIATGSITRGFMARPCDVYFTMEMKLRRYIDCCMTLYRVPEETRRHVVDRVLELELRAAAEKIVADTIERAAKAYEELLDADNSAAPE